MVYSICKSKVLKGQGLASKYLLPTLNLDVNCLPSDFKYGVYSCRVFIANYSYLGMMHYGPRSTDSNISLEVHVIDTLLDEGITYVEFQPLKFVREVKFFESLHDLKKQLGLDLINVVNND